MKKIKFILKNNGKSIEKFDLLDFISNGPFNNYGLPASVSLSIQIGDNDMELSDISYHYFLLNIQIFPCQIKINKTTNNRQLMFYTRTIFSHNPLMLLPCTDENGNETNFHDQRKWNLSDSHENFTLNGFSIFKLILNPNQDFEIEIDVVSKNVKFV